MNKLFGIVLVLLVGDMLFGINDAQSAEKGDRQSIEFLNNNKDGESQLPFSEAVKVGNLLFLSGQIGVDVNTSKLVSGGLVAETTQTMQNIKNTLERHGYSMSEVVKCTVMLADIAEWQKFNQVYVTFFSKPFPARSAFGANGLALNSRVEVECIAAKLE